MIGQLYSLLYLTNIYHWSAFLLLALLLGYRSFPVCFFVDILVLLSHMLCLLWNRIQRHINMLFCAVGLESRDVASFCWIRDRYLAQAYWHLSPLDIEVYSIALIIFVAVAHYMDIPLSHDTLPPTLVAPVGGIWKINILLKGFFVPCKCERAYSLFIFFTIRSRQIPRPSPILDALAWDVLLI